MKTFTFTLALLAAGAFTANIHAADDFTKGTNYHLIYLDEETTATIPAASIAKDYRPDDVKNFLYVWDNTYTGGTSAGPNWNGVVGEYLTYSVATSGWSGLGFASAAGTPKDMSGVTADFTFHIACKTTNTASHLFGFDGGTGITAKLCIGAATFIDGTTSFEPYADFARDGQWHLIEIPVSQLFTLGLRYPEPFSGNVFWLLSGGITGTTISMDAIYFYKKAGTGISNAKSDKLDVLVTNQTLSIPNATLPIELFSITGVKVKTTNENIMGIEDVQQGIYIVRCGGLAQKIQIK